MCETQAAQEKYLLEVKDLKMAFPAGGGFLKKNRQYVHAVDGVSFQLRQGETLGIVGESGCGKSTIGNLIIRLLKETGGRIVFDGHDITAMSAREFKPLRREMQMVFQDPFSSLNPRKKVFDIIAEPYHIQTKMSGREIRKNVEYMMELVGLDKSYQTRYPHEFSGGQRQRIGIARALAIEPEFIVCDEPISALDVSIQSQVINLLHDLQEKLGLTYLFIAHDLNIVKYISDRIAVMYLGNVVELASSEELYKNTLHPYSQALLSAVPIPDPSAEAQKHRIIISGDVPSPINTPKGCNFAGRCPKACDQCKESKPPLQEITPGHYVACHLVQPEKK